VPQYPAEIRPESIYTLAEVCQLLRISGATVRRWIKSRNIPALRAGRAYRLPGRQLLAALEPPRATPTPRGPLGSGPEATHHFWQKT